MCALRDYPVSDLEVMQVLSLLLELRVVPRIVFFFSMSKEKEKASMLHPTHSPPTLCPIKICSKLIRSL